MDAVTSSPLNESYFLPRVVSTYTFHLLVPEHKCHH